MSEEADKFSDFDLRTSAREGDLETLKGCISQGLDVNVECFGLTPLHFAGKEGNAAIIEALIKAGAEIDKLDGVGWTALDHAIEYKKVEAIRMLLQLGAKKKVERHEIPKSCRPVEQKDSPKDQKTEGEDPNK